MSQIIQSKYCGYSFQSYESTSPEVNRARFKLLRLIREEQNGHAFPSLNKCWGQTESSSQLIHIPEIHIIKDEEKSPPCCSVKNSSNFLLHLEEVKPSDVREQSTVQSRIYSASAMHLLEQLEPIPAIKTQESSNDLRCLSSKLLDFKFRSIIFKPENKVLVGHQKLRKQLKRTKSAEAAFQSKEMLSAFQETFIQQESILSTSFDQEIEQVDEILSSRDRCRRGLAFLHNYFKPVNSRVKQSKQRFGSFKTQISNLSQDITEASSKEESSKTVDDVNKKQSESSTSSKSELTNFSEDYYKHLSSMLSCFIENETQESKQREERQKEMRSREMDLFEEQNEFQKWYVCDLEEFSMNGEIILNYTRKLKEIEQEQ